MKNVASHVRHDGIDGEVQLPSVNEHCEPDFNAASSAQHYQKLLKGDTLNRLIL